MVAPFTGLLPLRDLYTSDEEYLTFFDTTVSKALTSLLACMIHKDILWKPINHSILMTCRDSRSVVRLMAVSMLQYMFAEVNHFVFVYVYILFMFVIYYTLILYFYILHLFLYTVAHTFMYSM